MKKSFLPKMLLSCILHATGASCPEETLAKKFAAQTSVLAAASFLSCLLKYHVWSSFARAKLCFTSEATPFGGVIDARAQE
jgi:hypothetical protein